MKCPFKQHKLESKAPQESSNEDNSFSGILAKAMREQELNERLLSLNECDEWECAWWCEKTQKCAVVVIAENTGR